MIKSSPYLSKRFKQRRTDVEFVKSHGTFKALSAEKKAKDGLNVHFAVFDEIHEYEDTTLIDVIKRSRGQRTQPLIMYISTAGYTLDGPMMDLYDHGSEVLEKYDDNLDERTFFYLAKMDNVSEIEDVNMWIKANPNIAMMNGVSLITDFQADRRVPSQYSDWVTKQFNLFSESNEGSYVSVDTINQNNGVLDPKLLRGRQAIGGYDLSETEDFTAAALEFPLDDGKVFILQHTFIPQARYDRDNDKMRMNQWIKDGDMELVPGDYVNYEYVLDWFKKMGELYKITQINYDRAKALFLNKSLEEEGFVTQETRQGFLTLGGPTQNFKELLLDSKVIFNNSGIFRWYLSNVVLRKDSNDNWLPKRVSLKRKIDGFAAVLNAHTTVVDLLIKKQGTAKVEYRSFADAYKKRRSTF
jgi:phage terminase large subunit-like protein